MACGHLPLRNVQGSWGHGPVREYGRTSDRRKHVHPSFHLRDDRADGSAAETTSIHHREAQAEQHTCTSSGRRLARREEIGAR